jgi:hypothetical protein
LGLAHLGLGWLSSEPLLKKAIDLITVVLRRHSGDRVAAAFARCMPRVYSSSLAASPFAAPAHWSSSFTVDDGARRKLEAW